MTEQLSVARLVAVPAVVTLAVSITRVVGEVQGWINTESGGGGALLGISWLIFAFGAWFGWKLVRADRRPPATRPALRAFGIALATAVVFILNVRMVQSEVYPFWVALSIACVVWPTAGVFAYRVWPELGRVLAIYGLTARVPTVVITAIAVWFEWGTHYEKVGPPNAVLEIDSKLGLFLASGLPQLLIWIPMTIVFGGLMGSLVATWTRRGR